MDNSIDLRVLQLACFDALQELKKICDEHNIEIYLRGGSVMGAVKYKGFIPWDDDIDIAIPRRGYEKLIKIFSENSLYAGKYQFLSYQYCDKMHCYFPRVILDEKERLRLQLPKNTNLGLNLIDVLPLDGAPNTLLFRNIYFFKVYVLRVLASLGTKYEGEHIDMHGKKQKLFIDLLKKMRLQNIFKQKSIYEVLDKLYKRYDYSVQNYAGTITASLKKKEVMKTDIWGKGVLCMFEDAEFLIPSNYDSYLKRLYGINYLNEEPSKEDRKSHLGVKE